MPGRRVWTVSDRSAGSTTVRTSTYWSAASRPARRCWRCCCNALEMERDSTMPSAPADAAELLTRLRDDKIENFWITYHDYSGVGAAKTIPPTGFRSAANDGLVFAIANLDMDILDHFAPDA